MGRLKFSIRSLLLIAMVAAITAAVVRQRTERYNRVGRDVAMLREMGFVVDLERPKYVGLSRYATSFQGFPIYIRLHWDPLSTSDTDQLLEILDRNPSIRKLAVLAPINEQDASRLIPLPLEMLAIIGSPIGETLNVKASPTLQWVSFYNSRMNDASFQALGPMQNVTHLDLSETQVSDQSIDQLAALPKLKKVVLFRSRVTSSGAERLRELLPDVTVEWYAPRDLSE